MAVMANTTMANATIANTTQFMTPELLSKFVLQSWLVPKEPGENCASHSRIFSMFIVYNVVAVIVSLLMARPWYIQQQEAIQSSISRSFSKFFHRLLCLPEPQEPTTSPTSIQILFLAVLGFAIITMAAPLLSSLSIYLSHRDSVTFANMLAEWSTRPRATWLVFLTNYIASLPEDREKSESGHIVAAATTYIGEVIVSLFGVTLLRDQSRMPIASFDPSVDCSAVKCPKPGRRRWHVEGFYLLQCRIQFAHCGGLAHRMGLQDLHWDHDGFLVAHNRLQLGDVYIGMEGPFGFDSC